MVEGRGERWRQLRDNRGWWVAGMGSAGARCPVAQGGSLMALAAKPPALAVRIG